MSRVRNYSDMLENEINMRTAGVKGKMAVLLFKISQVGLLLALYGGAFGNERITSIGVWTILLSTFCIAVNGVIKKTYEAGPFLALVALLLISVLSMVYAGTFSYGALVSLFSFLEIPLLIVFTQPMESKERIKFTCLINVVISAVFIWSSFSERAYYFLSEYGIQKIDDLTLGYSNPNETAMHLLSCVAVLLACVYLFEKKVLRIILMVDSLYLVYLIFLTKSRACILLVVVLLILFVLCNFIKSIPKIWHLLSFLSPIYLAIISYMIQPILSERYFMGEVIDTGRTDIYLSRIAGLGFDGVIFGDFSYFFENSLNAYISILITIGVLGLFLFLIILYSSVKTCREYSRKKWSLVAFSALLILLFHASAESANFVSGSFYAASFYSIYVVAIDGYRELER